MGARFDFMVTHAMRQRGIAQQHPDTQLHSARPTAAREETSAPDAPARMCACPRLVPGSLLGHMCVNEL